MEIAVAGDLRGHLVGTVSNDGGQVVCCGVTVVASGITRLGRWEAIAQTDEDGLFRIALPVSLSGNIEIMAQKAQDSGAVTVACGDIARYLTPHDANNEAKVIKLDGIWDLCVDPPEYFTPAYELHNWDKIKVPSHWEMEGYISETGRAAYRKTVFLPREWANKSIKFKSYGIYSKAEVWLNGVRAGSHTGGVTPFELDLTDTAKFGQANTLVIVVSDESVASILDAMSYYAQFNLGGIWRPLEIFCVERAHISRVAVSTVFDDDYRDAELTVDLDILNEQDHKVEDASIKIRLYNPDGEMLDEDGLIRQTELLPWNCQQIRIRTKIRAPEQWNAEEPRLYKLVAELNTGESVNASIEQSFGFRAVEIKDKTFLINGRPVKLFGACHHDAHPLDGRAVSEELSKQDIELMKSTNMNALRTSHYPPHPSLLEYTDRLGMYVEVDLPFCFAGCNPGPEEGMIPNIIVDDLRVVPLCIRVTMETIEWNRNHPSVVLWTQCNESAFGKALDITLKYAKAADVSRPFGTGASSDIGLAFYLEKDIRDRYNDWCTEKGVIATYHYIGNAAQIDALSNFNVPVFHDEALAFFTYTQPLAMELDPGMRDYWITGYFNLYNAIIADKLQIGALIWGWADDNFLVPGKGILYGMTTFPKVRFAERIYKMPGRGVVGNFPWGVVDGWRRPRPEQWTIKKLFTPVFVEERPRELPQSGNPVTIHVQNRNMFINLNRYRIKWKIADETGECITDVAPQSSGEIWIVPQKTISANDTLVLEFFDPNGVLVDGYRLKFDLVEIPGLPSSGQSAQFKEEKRSLNFGKILRLVGKDSELAFDRTSGMLIRGMSGKTLAIMEGPNLHIMKDGSPMEETAENWKFTDEEHFIEGSHAVLVWKGKYGEWFDGAFRIQMDDGGNGSVEYDFQYSGPCITAREVGLIFKIPLDCDRFEWDRKAEWSYYPEDHIGRPHGVAYPHSDIAQSVPPTNRPFGLDDSLWGCNDFRSTKRHIYWAEFAGADHKGVRFIAGGNQHVRAKLGFDCIDVNILDYYGGNAIGDWAFAGSYETGQIIDNGNRVAGTVVFKFV